MEGNLGKPSTWIEQRAKSETVQSYVNSQLLNVRAKIVENSLLFIIECFADPWSPTHQMPVTLIVMKISQHTNVLWESIV